MVNLTFVGPLKSVFHRSLQKRIASLTLNKCAHLQPFRVSYIRKASILSKVHFAILFSSNCQQARSYKY
jgi:DNA-binding transcriptional regulator YiaG